MDADQQEVILNGMAEEGHGFAMHAERGSLEISEEAKQRMQWLEWVIDNVQTDDQAFYFAQMLFLDLTFADVRYLLGYVLGQRNKLQWEQILKL
jgi:hypothetical protein